MAVPDSSRPQQSDVPLSAMLDVEAGLATLQFRRRDAADLARLFDQCLHTRRPMQEWLACLAREEETRKPVPAPTASQIVCAIRLYGAEQAIRLNAITASDLHAIVLDEERLQLLLVLAENGKTEIEASGLRTALAILAALYLSTPSRGSRGDLATPLIRQPGRTATDLAQSTANSAQRELRDRFAEAVFPLLQEIGVELAAGVEVAKATELLHHLIGDEPVGRFQELDRWLSRYRAGELAGMERLADLAPELTARDEVGDFAYALSFRLFARCRLAACCRQEGWHPEADRFNTLDEAISALTRDRIGAILAAMIDDSTMQNAPLAKYLVQQG